MAHVKVVEPAGWDEFEGQVARLVKVSSAGLRGADRHNFIKRAEATANVFLPYLDSVKFAGDEEPVHVIALGAEEAYGPNRNGDAFDEHTCKTGHDSFVKFARWYRNHQNKDPSKSYGVIKLSAYNPVMRRVELLIGLNKEKSAAERNGGLVADKELQKLARGDDLAVSMACRVPWDVCTACGNRARTREEYCKAASCKAGGCAENLAKLVKLGNDTHLVAVRNPNAVWFDMSHVFRPADRICYGNRADYLTKSAGAVEEVVAPLAVVLAQDVLLPGGWGPHVAAQVKLAHALAEAEGLERLSLHPDTRRAFAPEVQPDLKGAAYAGEPGTTKFAGFLGALADQKIVLPLREFAALVKKAELAPAATGHLPGVYRRMIADGSLERRVQDNPFTPAEKLASAAQRLFAAVAAPHFSLGQEHVDGRVLRSVVRGHACPGAAPLTKQAADAAAEGLARDYALYKVAALRRIAAGDQDFLLTCRFGMVQDSVA